MKISDTLISESFNYQEYRRHITDLFEMGQVTGDVQKESYLDYTRLNEVRMNRWDKHFIPSQEMEVVVKGITHKRIWLVLTEGWCGDSAQMLPAIQKIADLNSKIIVKYLIHDHNKDLMDMFLTNGTRSIPIVICIDENYNVLWHYGPRPKTALRLIDDWKTQGVEPAVWKEKLHLWYAQNKQADLQRDLLDYVKSE